MSAIGLTAPSIRALAYFAPYTQSAAGLKEALERGITLLEEIAKALKRAGIEVLSLRLSLPIQDSPRRLPEVSSIAADFVKRRLLVSVGAYKSSQTVLNAVREGVADLGLYATLLFDPKNPAESAESLSRLIHEISEKNPEAATRFSIGFHEGPLETPYFPDSTSSGVEGIGVSFLYPKYISELLRGGLSLAEAFEAFKKWSAEAQKVIREAYSGRIVSDYSLSPWMENSVVEVVEALGGRLLMPRSLYIIGLLNKEVGRIARESRNAVGFNEVMLPYAEDSSLMELGREGRISGLDFVFLSSVCVSGPDMLVLPSSVTELKGLILDWFSVAKLKGRPSAMRAVVVNGEPGEIVSLGKFGKVPVIPYSRVGSGKR